jgi:hypothetical protein
MVGPLLVTLDAEKAFDKLNHEILFNKLYHYGIVGDTLGYMTKTLNHIIFFSSTKIRIFFSATLGIRIFF